MPNLSLYRNYSRKDIHDIFSPDAPFTLGSGSWGIWGIVEIPNRPKDYVFLVSFGQEIAGHVFEKYVTEDGVLNWQSQPRQTITERRIVDFIGHDELASTVHLWPT